MNSEILTAIKELQQQSDQCGIDCISNSGWKATTGTLIKRYTGEHSHYYSEYKKWLKLRPVFIDLEEFGRVQQTRVKALIEQTILEIRRRGIYTPPKRQIIKGLLNWQSVLILLLLTGGIFEAGYQIGSLLTEKTMHRGQASHEAELDSFRRGLKVSPLLLDEVDRKTNQRIHPERVRDGK